MTNFNSDLYIYFFFYLFFVLNSCGGKAEFNKSSSMFSFDIETKHSIQNKKIVFLIYHYKKQKRNSNLIFKIYNI